VRNDIQNKIYYYSREESEMVNKSEMARRLNCDPRTIDRYLKIKSGEIVPQHSKRVYESLLDDYKTVIIFRYFEDMKIADIANVLGENINTIKTRLYKALKLLKIKIEEEGVY